MSAKVGMLLSILALSSLTVSSCTNYRPNPGFYSEWYEDNLSRVSLPSMREMEEKAKIQFVDGSSDKIWSAILNVASQSYAILALDDETKTILFVNGERQPGDVPFGYRNSSMIYDRLSDVWMVVTLQPDEQRSGARVLIAWLNPDSGKIVSPDYDKKIENVELVQNTARLVSDRFLYDIEAHVEGPPKWREKYVDKTPQGSIIPVSEIEYGEGVFQGNHIVRSRKAGNWFSLDIRRYLTVISDQKLEESIDTMVSRLKSAAGRSQTKIEAYILSDAHPFAFASPNNEIFISSGLLTTLDSIDELAAVIAHELDHVFRNDTIQKWAGYAETTNTQFAIMVVGMGVVAPIAATGATIAMMPSSYTAFSSPTIAMQVAGNVATSASINSSMSLSRNVGIDLVTGFSQEQELRADRNGARYMHAAGYDLEAEISMLEKLAQIQTVSAVGDALKPQPKGDGE